MHYRIIFFILFFLFLFLKEPENAFAQSNSIKSDSFGDSTPPAPLPGSNTENKNTVEAGALNDRFSVKLIPKVTLGPPDEKDPFGVDFSGPLEKAPTHVTAETEIPKITLQMVVNQLTVQVIFSDTKEALVNSYLLNEGDRFNVEWGTGTFTLILKKVETGKLLFTWTNDDKNVIYLEQNQEDIFASSEADPMTELNQPPLIHINLNTPAKTEKLKTR